MESTSWQAHRQSLLLSAACSLPLCFQCGRIATRTLHTITIPRSNTTHSTPRRWLVDLAIRLPFRHRHSCPRWQSAPSRPPSLNPPNVCTPRPRLTVPFACLPLAPALQLHIDVNSRVMISFTCRSHFNQSSPDACTPARLANPQAPCACAVGHVRTCVNSKTDSFKYGDSLCMI